MIPEHVVLVGGGLGGFRCAQSLRGRGFEGGITVVGDEIHAPYDRPPLSKQLLAGDFTVDRCRLEGDAPGVAWKLGIGALTLDRPNREVRLTDGSTIGYDSLVVATGRRARVWTGEAPERGVHTIRSLDDVARLRQDLVNAHRVVIIGAGFIGCEAAATLRTKGFDVVIVDVATQPMAALGELAGEHAREIHASHGIRFFLGHGVAEIRGGDSVAGVVLDDGTDLQADVVLVAIGSEPNSEWLNGSGLRLDGGVLTCDITGAAVDVDGCSVDSIYGVGDVSAWPHPDAGGASVCVEHWSNARDMADAVAKNLLLPASGRSAIRSVPAFWSDQYDVKIKSAGLLRAADEFVLVEENPAKSAMLIEARRRGEVIGAVAFNMNRAVVRYQRDLALALAS